MKLVIKDNKVLATHDNNQVVENLYPDCVIVIDDNFTGQLDDEYIVTVLILKEIVYKNIILKYDQCIKNGVFKINTEYYGNMSWYDTWSKAVNLYESGLILADTFTVRLYKSLTSEDGIYYNYDTTQTLSSFKLMLQTLNSQQFLTYQPIRNNLVSQLKLATTIEQVNNINSLISMAFGDIIDETTTIVQDGE